MGAAKLPRRAVRLILLSIGLSYVTGIATGTACRAWMSLVKTCLLFLGGEIQVKHALISFPYSDWQSRSAQVAQLQYRAGMTGCQ